MAENTN